MGLSSTIVLAADDPAALAAFYAALLEAEATPGLGPPIPLAGALARWRPAADLCALAHAAAAAPGRPAGPLPPAVL
ncbi:hypothetical protein [Synechococcus sp. CS-1331]|uniref:hypothetical protein n=1 Tax=Synechococcus sp. CS-1331 TaxID=2847973 RepID=UPI00223A7DD8|nr:hypothetical protein [Synechococcus sp. CS-1331]